MCGLTGIVSSTLTRDQMHGTVTAMRNALSHRGPDDAGIWRDQKIGLGHQRLSIVDLSEASAQPMHSRCGRYVIVYNGEIYNFRQLTKQYLGHLDLKHAGDTRVLIELIAYLGMVKSLKLLNGIFAFAVWDKHAETLYLARDRIGVKPLYWSRQNKSFLFSSELKSFFGFNQWNPKLNENALADYFNRYYICAPETIYQDCFKLMPGTLLVVNGTDLSISKQDYFQPSYLSSHPKQMNVNDATHELDHLLTQAVNSQMVADVPVGAFLSGGNDSSLIAAKMMQQKQINTFSIGYEDKTFDEGLQAQKIANILGTRHHHHQLTADEAFNVIEKIPFIYDEPFADASQIPTHFVSMLAKSKVTVALSGDGADELFAGYQRYSNSIAYWARLMKIPSAVRYLTPTLLKIIPSFLSELISKPILKDPKQSLPFLSQALACKSVVHYHRFVNHIGLNRDYLSDAKSGVSNLLGVDNLPKILVSPLSQLLRFDQSFRLPDGMLTKVDRASMAASLEVRVPFLDNDVVDFARRLPDDLRIHQGQHKFLLKRVLAQYLPNDIVNTPKVGFHLPVKKWLKSSWKDWAESFIFSESIAKEEQYLNMKHVRVVWHRYLAGDDDLVHPLWGVLMYLLWKQTYKLKF